MNNYPGWLKQADTPLFESRTLHVNLGLAPQNHDRFDHQQIQALLASILVKCSDTCLAIVQLSQPTNLRSPWQSLRKELTSEFDRYWNHTPSNTNGVLGEILECYDLLKRQTIYFALLVVPNAHLDERVIAIRTLNDIKKLPWLWPKIDQRSNTRLLSSLCNMSFRHFLFSQIASDENHQNDMGWAYHNTLLSITRVVKDVLIGHEIQLKINYFGSLVMSIRRTALTVRNEFEDKLISNLFMTAVRRGQYLKLDARTWFKDPYLIFPTQIKLSASEEKKVQELERIQQSEWVQQNRYYNILLSWLDSLNIDFHPITFAPNWCATPPLSQIDKSKPHPLLLDYQNFLRAQHRVCLRFSGVDLDAQQEEYAGQLQNLLREAGFTGASFNFTSKDVEESCDICLTINQSYQEKGTISSYWFWKDGKRQVRDSLSSLLTERATISSLDPYTQQKLALYHGNYQDWYALQGIDTQTLCEKNEKTQNVVAEKILFELYLKRKLAALPCSLPFPEAIPETGRFIGMLLINPAHLPPRIAVLHGQILPTEITLNNLELIATYDSNDSPLKAVQHWANINTSEDPLLKQCLTSEVIRWRQGTFVLLLPDEQQLLTVSSDALYCPTLLGQFDSTKEEIGYDLNRKKQGSVKSGQLSHQSPIPHLASPVTRAIYIEDCHEYLRVFPSIYRLQNTLPSSARLRDISVFHIDGKTLTRHTFPMEAKVFQFYLATLVSDLIKANAVSRSTLIEKLCRLAAVN